ncbi:carboxypeptidase S [Serendipita vermifera]|nr:carboxypeptidase S [Serendipita vermifera]
MESSPLLPSSSKAPVRSAGHVSRPGHVSMWRVVLVFILLVIPLLLLADLELPEIPWPGGGASKHHFCPQVEPIHPNGNVKVANKVMDTLNSSAFFTQAVGALSGAVKIRTETFDVMGPVGQDPAWKVFDTFQAYLHGVFPLVHKHLTLTKVNTYGLVYEWTGSNSTLKPILLAAHQDTVPVNPSTIDQWTYPPWSGHFDGEWIWGRGSMDDKSALISILLAIETLLSHRFKPHRTVVLAFGFDEEISGIQGAGTLAPYLESTYGQNGFSMLVDEGGVMIDMFGATFAAPAVGEKGYLDVKIEVTTPGGHSSIPPPNHHTGIGLLSEIIVLLENNTIPPRLSRSQPIYSSLHCLAEHGPDVPSVLRRAIQKSWDSNRALHRVEEIIFRDNTVKSTVGTTQAVDMIQGGVKSNALPELSWAIVNTRIATDSSLTAVKSHYRTLLKDFAVAQNITFIAFDETIIDKGSIPKIEISDAWGNGLEPAPVTPVNAAPYRLLAGSILATEGARGNGTLASKPVYVMPSVMSGNTDTRRYWNLTPHIFRYSHLRAEDFLGIHTVDEHIRASGLVGSVRFFANLLLNADEASDL